MELTGLSTKNWILLFYLFIPVLTCQPPDVPLHGSYTPERPKYELGDEIRYSCQIGTLLVGKSSRKCWNGGKWSGSTPFCDVPVELKNPTSTTTSRRSKAKYAVDNILNTCYESINSTGQSLEVYLQDPAILRVVKLYFKTSSASATIDEVSISVVTGRGTACATVNYNIENDQWITLHCLDNVNLTDRIRIENKAAKKNVLQICEIQVFVKDAIWCDTPPDIFIPKGYLVVSRDKAALRCQEGYKTGENTRLVCDKNKWSGPILKCDEILCDSVVGNDSFSAGGEWQMTERVNKFSFGTKRKLRCDPGYEMTGKPDTVTCLKNGTWSKTTARCIEKKQDDKKSFRIIAIAVGTVLVVLIFCLLGLTLYCVQRNRSKEVVVVYKPGESGQSQRESEDNYNSTVYYDVIHDPPPKPPLFPGTLNKGYSTPIDSRVGTNKLPADIAFGTLKTSTLYSS